MSDQPRQDLRGLKALVGVLGVLIILGTALVIGVVIHRLYARTPAPASMVPVSAGAMNAKTLTPGEKIIGIAGAGGDLAVWVSGPQGDHVLLIDPATGKVSNALRTAP